MALDTSSNGVVATDSETVQTASDFLASMESVNLDEVTTETIRVAIRCKKTISDPANPALTKPSYYTRIAEIENYVPMRVYNRMLATRSHILKDRAAYLSNDLQQESEQDPMLSWMLEQVYAVWKLSEPSTSLQDLEDGLLFEQVSKLFTRFFARLLQTSHL